MADRRGDPKQCSGPARLSLRVASVARAFEFRRKLELHPRTVRADAVAAAAALRRLDLEGIGVFREPLKLGQGLSSCFQAKHTPRQSSVRVLVAVLGVLLWARMARARP
ncbi:unnamed protein product [Symbiodinium natans]|uniref:Uncharacterized protein n=1 Tax=Symbiodinium natans TaxID=878477 RepID=A0A812LYI3_9DINO|nr:unnamed protein product [Symbiodinium natans]